MVAMRRLIGLILLSAVSLIMETTLAHTRWNPDGLIKPRSNRTDIKSGPCGLPAGDTPVTLEAGATITVEFESNIYHQGHFRIAFSPANDQSFDEFVLADNIPDYPNQLERSVEITLPDQECDHCSLQLIQVMLDRNPPTNYYSCADIALVHSENTQDTEAPPSVSDLLALPGDEQANLSWSNPSVDDFHQVLVVHSHEAATATPSDGISYVQDDEIEDASVVYVGAGESTTVANLAADTTHYFTVYSFDRALNYSAGSTTEVVLTPDVPNVAPSVSLVVEQNGQIVQDRITIGGGRVLIQANIQDMNYEDNHGIAWTTSDSLITDQDSVDQQFTFDPRNLAPGNYKISVRVTDSGEPPQATEANLTLTVAESNSTTAAGSVERVTLTILLFGSALAIRRSRRRQRR